MRGWIDWFAQGLWKRRRPIMVVVGLTIVFTAIVLYQNRDYRPPATIHDPTFVAQATAICRKQIPPLKAVRPPENGGAIEAKATADRIDVVATKLDAVVVQLKQLPVEAKNQRVIDEWFGHFADYTKAGWDYAAALRQGDPKVYNKVDDEGVAPLTAISDFGRANHLDACIP